MKYRFLAFSVLVFLCTHTANSQDNANDIEFRAQPGMKAYFDRKGATIGAIIPGYGNGFQRAIDIDDSLREFFLYGKPDPKYDELSFVSFDSSAKPLVALGQQSELEWLVYCGGHLWPASRLESQVNESKRCDELVKQLATLKSLRAVRIYDSTFSSGTLERLLTIEHLERVSLVECELESRNGGYTSLPNCDLSRVAKVDVK